MNRDNSYLIGNQWAKGNKPNSGSFKKDHVPWNKNKKGIHLSPKSEFKKGRRSANHTSVGTLKKRYRKRENKSRMFIKIAEQGKWEELAKYVWKQEYGFILKGDIIHHQNGDVLDDRLENLIALPRTDHPIFHSRWGLRQFTEEQLAYYIGRYIAR